MSLTTCRDCGKRFQIGPLLDLPQPTRCLECLIGLEAKLAAAEARCASLERQRSGFDCRFAGPYAEMSGSHCPSGKPCQRCELEAAEARVAELEEALRPFCDPESYATTEETCRKNYAMDWCAIHSFRWPCPVGPARRALAADAPAGEEKP